MKIEKLVHKLDNLPVVVLGFLQDIIKDRKEEIADLNTDQLEKGEKSTGEKIGVYRNPVYAQMKNRMNSKAGLGQVDLKLTGDFYDSIKAEVKSDGFEMIGDTEKDAQTDLVEVYGEEILGLSEESMNLLLEDVRLILREKIRIYLNE